MFMSIVDGRVISFGVRVQGRWEGHKYSSWCLGWLRGLSVVMFMPRVDERAIRRCIRVQSEWEIHQ